MRNSASRGMYWSPESHTMRRPSREQQLMTAAYMARFDTVALSEHFLVHDVLLIKHYITDQLSSVDFTSCSPSASTYFNHISTWWPRK